jgi:nitrogen fixation/metabolism regulation signal transduction histidine kinase
MFPRKSILLKLLLLTSSILVVIFACAGYLLSNTIEAHTAQSVEGEVVASFRAYEALWQEHTQNLRKISSVISRMPDVRAAFLTNDRATIQDSAGELWAHISSGNALFTLADGNGRVIASLGNESPFQAGVHLNFVETLAARFPEQQTGFFQQRGKLYQIVVTPVYVDTAVGKGLLTILVTGFELDRPFLRALKLASGGSDLIFKMRGSPLASTLTDQQP